MSEFILPTVTLLIGIVAGAVTGVAYLHGNFVSQRRYEGDQAREERELRYIRERVDSLLLHLERRRRSHEAVDGLDVG